MDYTHGNRLQKNICNQNNIKLEVEKRKIYRFSIYAEEILEEEFRKLFFEKITLFNGK